MQLSEFQKQIVGTILTGETCHIETFFEKYYVGAKAGYPERSDWGHYGKRAAKPSIGRTIHVVGTDVQEITRKIGDFIAVWKLLFDAKLVVTIPCHRQSIYPLYREDENRNLQTCDAVLILFSAFDNEQIVPLPALEEFVRAGYKTQEEIRQEEEKRNLQDEIADRKNSQTFTKRIAYFSIAASIVSVVVSGIFNFITYKTDRTVTITNARAFPDTTRVYLVNPSAPADTNQATKPKVRAN